jgi:hypothetical protein
LAIDGDIEVFYFERVHKNGEFRMVSFELVKIIRGSHYRSHRKQYQCDGLRNLQAGLP